MNVNILRAGKSLTAYRGGGIPIAAGGSCRDENAPAERAYHVVL